MASTQPKLSEQRVTVTQTSEYLDPIKKKTADFGRTISYDEVKYKNFVENRSSGEKTNDKKTDVSGMKS